MKTCSKCHETKPLSEFSLTADKRRKTQKPKAWCKVCCAACAKEHQQANKETTYPKQKEWREANPAQWNFRMAIATQKRRAAKLQRIPLWAESNKTEQVYAMAAELRAQGQIVDVDHIVPLQGDLASGLHAHWNLQILPAGENRAKRNAVDFDAYQVPNALAELST